MKKNKKIEELLDRWEEGNMSVQNLSDELYILFDFSYCLNQLKEKGYHRRFSGAMIMSDSWMNCDCCGRKTKVKIGYEANYPQNPDMALCSMCSDELIDLYSN